MKPRWQSQQFPSYLSQYYKQQQNNYQTLNLINDDTNDSVFNRKVFSICDIIGNFGDGFIVVHFQGYLYLIDQHAASQKSLFIQYMLNPTQKYSIDVSYITFLPNYYRQILSEKKQFIFNQGWIFQQIKKRAQETEIKIIKAPQLYNKCLQQQDFLFLIQKLYNQKGDQQTNFYSQNQRNAMATFACRNAYKVGDRLKFSQMRGLIDSLYKMQAPFNCPHGRPTIASLGKIKKRNQSIAYNKQYIV